MTKQQTLQQELESSTAIQSPAHLKRWLEQSGRRFLIMRTDDLVDALPWPHGVDALIQIVEAYRQHRLTQPVEHGPCPHLARHEAVKQEYKGVCPLCRNKNEVVTRSKDDRLELDEIRDARAFLQLLEQDR